MVPEISFSFKDVFVNEALRPSLEKALRRHAVDAAVFVDIVHLCRIEGDVDLVARFDMTVLSLGSIKLAMDGARSLYLAAATYLSRGE